MKQIIAMNPFHCCMWGLHDRLDMQVSEGSCRGEIASFIKHGQLIPVLGRPMSGDPLYKVELIYGARRLFVARHINVPLQVELRNMSDREAIVAMDIENRQRVDISPYERGVSYARWLRAGHFQSQEDIARALHVSASQVSRLLRLAQLPSVILAVFDNPAAICEGWGLEIMQRLDDPAQRQGTIRAARSIASMSPRPKPSEAYQRLLAPAVGGRRIREQRHDEVVRDRSGKPLFRIRRQREAVALIIPIEKVTREVLDNLRQTIAGVLQEPSLRGASAWQGATVTAKDSRITA